MSYQQQMNTIVTRFLYHVICLQAEALTQSARQEFRDYAEKATHYQAIQWAKEQQIISDDEYRELFQTMAAFNTFGQSIYNVGLSLARR